MRGVDDLEVALDVGVGGGVEDRAARRVEDHGGRLAGEHQLPGLARVFAPPDAAGWAAHGGVDDHPAAGRGLGIDDDLVGRVADELAIAAGGVDRQDVAAGIDVVGAVVEVPGRPAVVGDQEADARRAGVALAGRGDDDRLVGVVIAGEDGDPADVDAGGGAEVGERNPGRARGAGREEVGRLPDAAAGAGGVDRVARGVGGSMARPVTRPEGSAPGGAGSSDRSTPGRPPSTLGSTGRRPG